MRQKFPRRRQAAAGLVLMVLGGIAVASAVPVSAGPRSAAASVPPTVVPGNPTCSQFAPMGASWTELKVEPVTNGVHTDGTLSVTLTVIPNEETGPTFNWVSNIGVDAVVVKGGDDANLYVYNPESTGDTALNAPVNPNGKFAGLSHVSFCYDVECCPTTTTTTMATTSTTKATTTSTTAPTTTTVVESTTTSAPPPTTAPRPPAPPKPTLPVTGGETVPLLVAGGLLLALGTALVASSRRRRADAGDA